MKNSIKFLVTFAIAIMTNACGASGGFHTGLENGSTRAQEARLQLEACQDAGNCTEQQQAAISASPELADRRSARPMSQRYGANAMSAGMPVYGMGGGVPGMAPYGVPQQAVYLSGGDLAWGVATLDPRQDTCGHQCVRLYVDQLVRGGVIDTANALSVEVETESGGMLPIYFNGRIPEPITDILLSDGSHMTRPAYLAPVPPDFRTGIRFKLEDGAEHTVNVTLYRKGRYKYTAIGAYRFVVSNRRFEWNILSGAYTSL